MSSVVLENVSKYYDQVAAVDALNLDVRAGEFITLLGPSGCGKTTTLRMIAGFVEPSRGRVHIANEDVTRLPPQQRTIGMVFQDYALFPHLTIGENIGFGLVERKVARDQIAARVEELLALIRLPEVAGRFPSELSGGQQQRVALARAIAFPPKVLLMDEPLGALDLKLREAMQLELRLIQQKLKITTVYVTHDQTEAMTMSDRIAVMNAGRIEQLDDPPGIYNAPRTRFVANFVGKVNFLPGRLIEHCGEQSAVETRVARILGPRLSAANPGAAVTVAVRPEKLRLLPEAAADAGMNVVAGQIETQTFAGNLYHDLVRTADGSSLLVEIRPFERIGGPGERVRVCWSVGDTVILDDA
ncbi:MAG: ABC transporter ATP-binding protein [Betaproteobacteria bacterium]|nr:ABC transporter ATP-binding protein [Betaproteobacteria bacterium]